MNKNQQHSDQIVSILTIIAAFLMGFIDAYTFIEQNHVFASAQTGNMVTFGVKLFTGQWRQAGTNLIVFFGFAIGAFLGEIFLARFSRLGLRKYRVFLYVQAVLLLLLAIYQLHIGTRVIVFLLGVLSGYELTMFRKIRTTPVNNGIMTGNARNAVNSVYRIVFEKDPQAKKDFINLLIGILMFVLGVGTGTLIVELNPAYALWGAFSLVSLSILALFFVKDK